MYESLCSQTREASLTPLLPGQIDRHDECPKKALFLFKVVNDGNVKTGVTLISQ